MVQRFLVNIDLTGNELQNFAVQPLATAPTLNDERKVGRKYFNSAEGREAIHDGKAWKLSVYKDEFDVLGGNVSDIDSRLITIESFFEEEEISDKVINKWKEITDFLNNIGDTTLNGVLEAYTVNTRKIEGDGTTIVGGGDLTENRTFSLKDLGLSGTHTKVTIDKYGRVISGTTLDAADIPTLAIAKIDGLQAELDNRYTKDELATYKSWWDDVKQYVIRDGNNIRIKTNLIVEGDTASGGESGSGGGTSIGVSGIFVNGQTWRDEDGDGVIVIPDYPISLDWSSIDGKPVFAAVATSGSYDDLSNKPTIESLMGATAIGGTDTYAYWDGSKWTGKKLGSLAFKDSLSKSDVGLGNVENTKLSTWAGTANITTVGTITSGTWNGTKIANDYLANNSMTIAGTTVALGGTLSASDLATAMVGEKLTKKYASSITRSTATSYTINHALNTRDVVVMVYDPSSYEQVMVDVKMTDANNVTLSFAIAPEVDYKVVIVG